VADRLFRDDEGDPDWQDQQVTRHEPEHGSS
jgi:hypothetical protein